MICRHRETGRIKRFQLRALYQNNPRFWNQAGKWEYFLDRETTDAIAEALSGNVESRSASPEETSSSDRSDSTDPTATHTASGNQETDRDPKDSTSPPEMLPNFGEVARHYSQLKVPERVGLMQKSRNKLDELGRDENATEEAVAEALVDATRDAALTNRATLLEALRQGNDQARAYTQQIVLETHKMVKSTMRLVDSSVYNDELVRSLVEKSNGTVVQHMTRVFLMGLEFLLYYNRQVITRGIANRIRIRFKRDYKEFYRELLPHLHEDYVSLEHVFYGGMAALSELEINKFATGFLVHDVGKADDIEYHEGESGFDKDTVERHVKIGYKAVMEKTNYPREAALITGYHHEYYGHPRGYGYFREFLEAYKKSNPAATQDYVMSYAMEPVIDYQVLAYFPAKMLEVVDVFDSLTDPNRLYRKAMQVDEALELIQDEFIVKNRKVDPILFDIFLDFLEQQQ